MSLINTLRFLWSHRPTQAQIDAVEAIGTAAKSLLQTIEAKLPDAAGKQAAVRSVNEAVVTANLALASSAAADADAAESSTLAP